MFAALYQVFSFKVLPTGRVVVLHVYSPLLLVSPQSINSILLVALPVVFNKYAPSPLYVIVVVLLFAYPLATVYVGISSSFGVSVPLISPVNDALFVHTSLYV